MPLDKDKASNNLKEILDRMQNNTDAALLHEYYKLFKKEVPFFKRSYAAAWLFMNYDSNSGRAAGSGSRSSNAFSEKTQNKKTASPQVSEDQDIDTDSEIETSGASEKIIINLPEEGSKRLFISIGKNRRLFPREIISLLMTRTSCEREDIGNIRILDNYSFVQVKDAKAEEIIETLTGFRFRGRTLTVNYAKPKAAEPESEE